eukprot:Rmarinus@m.10887
MEGCRRGRRWAANWRQVNLALSKRWSPGPLPSIVSWWQTSRKYRTRTGRPQTWLWLTQDLRVGSALKPQSRARDAAEATSSIRLTSHLERCSVKVNLKIQKT